MSAREHDESKVALDIESIYLNKLAKSNAECDRYRKALGQIAADTHRKGGDFARLGRIAREALDA